MVFSLSYTKRYLGPINRRGHHMIDTSQLDTRSVLKIANEYARVYSVDDVVIATTKGHTALVSLDVMDGPKNIVAVTHSTGFRERNNQELDTERRKEIEEGGIKVLTSVMPFHTWNDHYRKKYGSIMPSTMIADTLRLFGQGTKVCVEIAMMAGDAGLIPQDRPVLCIAGTGRGADTVLLIKTPNTRRFFDIRIMDVIAKPRKW